MLGEVEAGRFEVCILIGELGQDWEMSSDQRLFEVGYMELGEVRAVLGECIDRRRSSRGGRLSLLW